jgi:hypothetical protein
MGKHFSNNTNSWYWMGIFPYSSCKIHRPGRVVLRQYEARMEWKPLLDLYAYLKVSHFSGVFHADDMLSQPFLLQTLFEFVLGLCGSKNLDLCGVTDMRDDLVIVFAEMVPETPVAYFLRGTISRDNGGVKDVMLHIRSDYSPALDIVGNTYNDGFAAADP